MLTTLYVLAFLAVCTLCGYAYAAATPRPPCDIDLMVETLRQIENWDGHSRGAADERGPWQLTPAIWIKYSEKPFAWAEGRSTAERTEQRRVAREHVYAISQQLLASRRDRDAFTVAVVWTAGWTCFFYWHPHRPSRAKIAYGRRAENLYNDLANNPDNALRGTSRAQLTHP